MELWCHPGTVLCNVTTPEIPRQLSCNSGKARGSRSAKSPARCSPLGHTRNVTRKMGSCMGPNDAAPFGQMQARATFTVPLSIPVHDCRPGEIESVPLAQICQSLRWQNHCPWFNASDPGVFWTVSSSPAIAARKSTRRSAFLCSACVLAICRRSDAVSRETLLTMGADGIQWLNLTNS